MKQEKHFVVDILFVLALFCVFTVSALVLVTIGADVYQHTMRDMSNNYNTRNAVAYITEKVRQNDCLLEDAIPSVELAEFCGQPALTLNTELEEGKYCTYLYYYDGYLRELLIAKDSYIGSDMLSAGQKVMPLESLEYKELSGRLIQVSMVTEDGAAHSVNLSIRCK